MLEKLETQPELELEELTQIYVHRGLDSLLARKVATDGQRRVGRHARDELGILEHMVARSIQAALTSASAYNQSLDRFSACRTPIASWCRISFGLQVGHHDAIDV